jgi:tyrosyl-tRNA synthetase
MYHSKEAAVHAEAEFENVFKNKGLPEDIQEYKAKKDMLLIDALAESKIVASKSEARRLIEQGGIKIDDKSVTAMDAKAEKGIVRVGKRKFLRIAI